MAVEQGKNSPALSGSMAFMGGILGLIFANLTVFVLLNQLPHEMVIQYGWRIPFLMSALIWLVLYQIRRFINEPFECQAHVDNRFLALIKAHKKELVICFITASLSASAFYMTFVFMPTLLSSVLQSYTHQKSIWVTLVSLTVYFVTLPVFGALADKIGGNKVTIIAFLFFALGIYLLYSGPNTGIFFQINLGLLVGIGLGGTAISVQIGEVGKHFPNKTRGLAIGIVVAMASIGYFFSPMYTKFALSAFGWEKTLQTFLYFIIFGMIAGIFLFPVKKEKITRWHDKGAGFFQFPEGKGLRVGKGTSFTRHNCNFILKL